MRVLSLPWRCPALLLLGMMAATILHAQPRADVQSLGDDLQLRRLTGTVWLHTSKKEIGGSMMTSNGLVIATPAGSILIDTPWDTSKTRRLLRWASVTLRNPIRVAVVTHAHDDRMGGISLLRDAAIPVHAIAMTAERAARQGWPAPDSLFSGERTLSFGGRSLDFYYPGAAHAPDNIVVWLVEEKILFGGCLVKSANDNTLGCMGDADPVAWGEALRRVTLRYPDAKILVPGHGEVGDRRLLLHTLELLQRRK